MNSGLVGSILVSDTLRNVLLKCLICATVLLPNLLPLTDSHAAVRISIFRPGNSPNDIEASGGIIATGGGEADGEFYDGILFVEEFWTGNSGEGWIAFQPAAGSDPIPSGYRLLVCMTIHNCTNKTWESFCNGPQSCLDPSHPDICQDFFGDGVRPGESIDGMCIVVKLSSCSQIRQEYVALDVPDQDCAPAKTNPKAYGRNIPVCYNLLNPISNFDVPKNTLTLTWTLQSSYQYSQTESWFPFGLSLNSQGCPQVSESLLVVLKVKNSSTFKFTSVTTSILENQTNGRWSLPQWWNNAAISLGPGDSIVSTPGVVKFLKQACTLSDASFVLKLALTDFNGCRGYSGNVDCDIGVHCTGTSGRDYRDTDIADLTLLIDRLFISLTGFTCPGEANVDASADGYVDIGDLTVLIDHLFVSLKPLPACFH